MKTKDPKNVTDRSVLDARNICALLRASHSCGVSELKFGDLYVRFFDSTTRLVVPPANDDISNFAESAEMASAPDLGRRPAVVPQGIAQEFADSQLLIDDSAAYETQMIDRLGEVADLDETVQRS